MLSIFVVLGCDGKDDDRRTFVDQTSDDGDDEEEEEEENSFNRGGATNPTETESTTDPERMDESDLPAAIIDIIEELTEECSEETQTVQLKDALTCRVSEQCTWLKDRKLYSVSTLRSLSSSGCVTHFEDNQQDIINFRKQSVSLKVDETEEENGGEDHSDNLSSGSCQEGSADAWVEYVCREGVKKAMVLSGIIGLQAINVSFSIEDVRSIHQELMRSEKPEDKPYKVQERLKERIVLLNEACSHDMEWKDFGERTLLGRSEDDDIEHADYAYIIPIKKEVDQPQLHRQLIENWQALFKGEVFNTFIRGQSESIFFDDIYLGVYKFLNLPGDKQRPQKYPEVYNWPSVRYSVPYKEPLSIRAVELTCIDGSFDNIRDLMNNSDFQIAYERRRLSDDKRKYFFDNVNFLYDDQSLIESCNFSRVMPLQIYEATTEQEENESEFDEMRGVDCRIQKANSTNANSTNINNDNINCYVGVGEFDTPQFAQKVSPGPGNARDSNVACGPSQMNNSKALGLVVDPTTHGRYFCLDRSKLGSDECNEMKDSVCKLGNDPSLGPGPPSTTTHLEKFCCTSTNVMDADCIGPATTNTNCINDSQPLYRQPLYLYKIKNPGDFCVGKTNNNEVVCKFSSPIISGRQPDTENFHISIPNLLEALGVGNGNTPDATNRRNCVEGTDYFDLCDNEAIRSFVRHQASDDTKIKVHFNKYCIR